MNYTLLARICCCFIVLVAAASPGWTADTSRKVGYGGETWSVDEIFPEGPHRDLAVAAAKGDLKGMDRAIKAGADVNYYGKGNLTPLWWTTWDQNLKGFSRLLELGADPNVVLETAAFESRNYKPDPVMILISQEFWDIKFLKAALAHGGDPDMGYGRHPLAAAIQDGTREHVDALLAAGASVNRLLGNRERGPVFAAIFGGRFDYVLLLLERGADPFEKDHSGRDLAQLIGMFPYNADSDQYVWRERVIRFLRTKGIEASPPLNEGKRTKPLPSDLK